MKINKSPIIVGMLIAFGLFFELAAHADENNQETTITFSAPVQIPGQVLSAGTYTFELANPDNDQQLVRIFNADGRVLATLQTVPTETTGSTSDSAIVLARAGVDKPDFLVDWFYPGETVGHEFVYPKQQEQVIARAAQTRVVANKQMTAGYAGGN
jgi:hypothetical protein